MSLHMLQRLLRVILKEISLFLSFLEERKNIDWRPPRLAFSECRRPPRCRRRRRHEGDFKKRRN